MGFTGDAAERVVAIDGQGLVNIEDFQELDEKTTESTCKGIRRPGGTVVGFPVSGVAEMNFKNMVRYMKNFRRINRKCTYADVMLESVRKFCHQMSIEDKHTDQTETPKVNPKNWSFTIESIVEYIGSFKDEIQTRSTILFFTDRFGTNWQRRRELNLYKSVNKFFFCGEKIGQESFSSILW